MSALSSRLSWLRAGVLGANDGIISVAGLVLGVAAATSDRTEIATAGVAGLVAGAVSMALGEYVSVSTQRDTERALVERERTDLADTPCEERDELVGILRERGFSYATATAAVDEVTAHDPLRAHLALELGIDPDVLANPMVAAAASAAAFTTGATLPLVAILLPPPGLRILVAVAAVLCGLVLTGWVSARLGHAPRGRAIVRLVTGGAGAMALTYAAGSLFGAAT